ncbi:MAG TPA: PAS domain S-box protein, partial [Polyangiales bacterium]
MTVTPSDDAQAQAELERLKVLSLLHQAPGFFCFLRGRACVFEVANPAYLELVGNREVLGKPLREALPELAGQDYFELIEQVFDTKRPFVGRDMRVLLQQAPGERLVERYVDFLYQPVLGAGGQVLGVLVQGHDVTQAQREAAAKQAVEARYRALFETIDDGFCIMQLLFDQEGEPVDYRFLEANAAFEEHTGLRNALGRTAREMVPDLDESWFRLYGKVALTGEAVRFENYAPAMGRWFEVYATRVGAPELRQVALVFKNSTGRKLAEVELQESEARFRNMADHAPVMLWVTDAAGQCQYLNRAWYGFTGQTEADALGVGWLEAVHPDDAERAGEVFQQANARREPFSLEYRLRRHDGVYRWAIDAAAPRFGPGHEFLGYIGSVTDISSHKQNEERREAVLKLEQSGRARAEEASRMKDEFLAMISHELRTPLSAVLGWVQMLMAGTLGPEKQRQALAVIERNARSQAQLIDDLLDVSRILSGKLRLEVEPTDLDMVVAQAAESVKPAADAKGIRLQVTLDSSSVVMGDPTRLQQVVWNLLSNAVKFTPKQGRVLVVVARRDSHVEIVVEDTGQGISIEFLPHVFERFQQADSGTGRRTGGLGLGLSIVKHLVE